MDAARDLQYLVILSHLSCEKQSNSHFPPHLPVVSNNFKKKKDKNKGAWAFFMSNNEIFIRKSNLRLKVKQAINY